MILFENVIFCEADFDSLDCSDYDICGYCKSNKNNEFLLYLAYQILCMLTIHLKLRTKFFK